MCDLDKWVSICRTCKYLPEANLQSLCSLVIELLIEESNVHRVDLPVTVCGDIHGQFYDLLRLFEIGGEVGSTNYVFLGDYVDRGYFSLETLTYLLLLKARFPQRVTLLRGNHETRNITKVYGFYDECLSKYGNSSAWRHCCEVFDYFTITATIGGSVLCVHGGLSPTLNTLDQVRLLDRNQEVPNSGAFSDLLWSDPEEVESWSISPRGAGWLFGAAVTTNFLEVNQLKMICRAHQLVNEGIKYMFDEKVVTIWSAPNYCYRCGNQAAIVRFNQDWSRTVQIFEAVPDGDRVTPLGNITPYFI